MTSRDPRSKKPLPHCLASVISALNEEAAATLYAGVDGVGEDEDLARCALGAGRMLRAPTMFEDVVNVDANIGSNG